MDMMWDDASGRGQIYSWTTLHHQFHPAFGSLPLTLAIVELDEGSLFRLVAQVSNAAADESNLYIGCAVEIVFNQVSADLSLPLVTALAAE
jgi:uncharacterized OB-fold protein